MGERVVKRSTSFFPAFDKAIDDSSLSIRDIDVILSKLPRSLELWILQSGLIRMIFKNHILPGEKELAGGNRIVSTSEWMPRETMRPLHEKWLNNTQVEEEGAAMLQSWTLYPRSVLTLRYIMCLWEYSVPVS